MSDITFKVTVTFEYSVSTKDIEKSYGTTNLERAAKIDEDNFRDDGTALIEMMASEAENIEVEVEAVE